MCLRGRDTLTGASSPVNAHLSPAGRLHLSPRVGDAVVTFISPRGYETLGNLDFVPFVRRVGPDGRELRSPGIETKFGDCRSHE